MTPSRSRCLAELKSVLSPSNGNISLRIPVSQHSGCGFPAATREAGGMLTFRSCRRPYDGWPSVCAATLYTLVRFIGPPFVMPSATMLILFLYLFNDIFLISNTKLYIFKQAGVAEIRPREWWSSREVHFIAIYIQTSHIHGLLLIGHITTYICSPHIVFRDFLSPATYP